MADIESFHTFSETVLLCISAKNKIYIEVKEHFLKFSFFLIPNIRAGLKKNI